MALNFAMKVHSLIGGNFSSGLILKIIWEAVVPKLLLGNIILYIIIV